MTRTLAGAGLLALGLALGALPGTTSRAEARGGCGPGFHPTPFGVCRPNGPRFGVFGPRRYGYGPRYGDGYGPRRFYGPRRDFY